MGPDIKQRAASMARARLVIAGLQGFILLFLLGLIPLYANTSQRYANFYNTIQEDGLWHVSQFDRFVRNLHEDILVADVSGVADETDLVEMSAAFDVLYSQVSVMEDAAFGYEFRTDEVVTEVASVSTWVRSHEEIFDRIASGYRPTRDEMNSLRLGVDSLLTSTSRLLSLTIGKVQNSRTEAIETIFRDNIRAGAILFVLILSATVLMYMLRRQLRVMRQATSEIECVADELLKANEKLSDKAAWLRSEVDKALAEVRDRDIEIVDRLSLAASYKDAELGSHTKRVGAYSELIAHHLGLSPGYCADIRLASPMHDIGKVAIPDSVLTKTGPLTDDEYLLMQRHTVVGGQILSESRSPLLQLAAEIAIGHHEHWNGQGYPNQASGETIPISARIVAVADTFDALTTTRSYKNAWPRERAIEYICEKSGDQFDPACVEAFRKALQAIVAVMEEEIVAVA